MSDHIFDSVFIDFSIFAFGYEMLSAVVRSMIRVEFKLVPNAIEYFAIPIVCQLGILIAAIFICIIEKLIAFESGVLLFIVGMFTVTNDLKNEQRNRRVSYKSYRNKD